jgi:Zn-dependent protease
VENIINGKTVKIFNMINIKTYKLGKLFDIPIYIDISFFAIAFLILLGTGNLISSIFIMLGFGVSILAHEYGHALTANKYGIHTKKITLSILGGCAEIERIPKDPSQEMHISIMGPIVSFGLFLCFSIFSFIFIAIKPIMTLFILFAAINLILGIFNLLPGFPMDGGRILRAWLSRKKIRSKATYIAMNVGRIFAIILASIGIINLLLLNFNGINSLLISWFIWHAGWQEYQMSLYGY